MTKTCNATACHAYVSTPYGRYCRAHVAQVRRHGAIGQTGITKFDLKIYLEIIRQRLARNRDGPIHDKLEARWVGLKVIAEAVMAESRSGRPMDRHRREAALEVLKLSQSVRPEAAVETILAMYLMYDQEPQRFINDEAFRTQLIRRVRGLTTTSADSWVDRRTGKRKRVYRDLSQRTVKYLAMWIAEALGQAGVWFSRLEKLDHEKQQAEHVGFREALRNLQ